VYNKGIVLYDAESPPKADKKAMEQASKTSLYPFLITRTLPFSLHS